MTEEEDYILWLKKVRLQNFSNNFARSQLILKIVLVLARGLNFQQNMHKISTIPHFVLLQYLVKCAARITAMSVIQTVQTV